MEVNDRVKMIRKDKKLTMKAFGEEIGLKTSTISMIESGKHGVSDIVVKAICKEYKVSEAWLRTGEGEMYIESREEKELDSFLEDIKLRPDIRKRLVMLLARLEPEQWEILNRYAHELIGVEPPEVKKEDISIEASARAKAEAYYQQLLAEEKEARKSSDSSRSWNEEGAEGPTADEIDKLA